jgi:3-hydroxy-3-methylglutaryl CoA synthase
MIGIVGHSGYVPRLRLSRRAVVDANAWYAPHLAGKAKGSRAMANFDEDSLTMAVAAARDCLGTDEDRSHVRGLFLASSTLPFVERLNAGIAAEALTLNETVEAADIGGSQRSALSAVGMALAKAAASGQNQLVLAADNRKTRAASSQELDYGDGAAAVLIGAKNVIAEVLGTGTVTADFVDHFRQAGEDIDYHWEERWVRDEGLSKIVPKAITAALERAGVKADKIDHFIFPSTFAKIDRQIAKVSGIKLEAIVDTLNESVGDTGVAHGLLVLSHVLETAKPGALILLAQFGSGAEAIVFRVTDAISAFRPVKGVGQWLARGVEEKNYTKFLAFNQQLSLERGMRGEQDKKTALTTAWRHRAAILGLVAGKCSVTGSVHYPPSRLSHDQGKPLLDTQKPYKLADRTARVLSWSAEYLSFHKSPPHTYGQVDFEGGGRILMEFTDVAKGDIASDTAVEMVFRVKDVDDRRGYTRYFWKATPIRHVKPAAVTPAKSA